jgi:hypothetical protein
MSIIATMDEVVRGLEEVLEPAISRQTNTASAILIAIDRLLLCTHKHFALHHFRSVLASSSRQFIVFI